MDPVQFLEGALGAAFGVGSAWMALKAALKNVTLTVHRHDATIDTHAAKFYEQLAKITDLEKSILKLKAEELGDLKLELVRITARAEAMQQDLDERADAAEKLELKFDKATAWQNETLMGIAVRTGATRKDSSQYRAAVDPRVESDSDAPKPMRPRLPTLRGKDE